MLRHTAAMCAQAAETMEEDEAATAAIRARAAALEAELQAQLADARAQVAESLARLPAWQWRPFSVDVSESPVALRALTGR